MSSGKGGGGATIIGYDYYASFAGLAGYGPADELVELIVDGKSAWMAETPILRSEVTNPYVLDVDGRGTVYFYWGTDDQTLADPVLATETSPGVWEPRMSRAGLPYRRRVLLVFYDFFCGFERLSAPDIKVVYRRGTNQHVVTGVAADLDDGQANPVAAMADLISDPTSGLAIPRSRLDTTSWQATADALHDTRSEHYLSLLLDRQMRLPEVIEEINGYADTWFWLNDAGQIAVGQFASFGPVPADLPELTQHDLTEPPNIRAHGYAELDDRVLVRYRDRDQAFSDAQVRFDTPLNRGYAETSAEAETSRPWITRARQAAFHAVRIGIRQSSPWDEVSLSVREVRVLALGFKVGDLFWLTYGPLNYTAVCRVTSLSGFADGGGAVTIEAETERGLGPAAFFPEPEAHLAETEEPIEELEYFDVIQATPELAYGQTYRVVPLAARHQPTVRAAEIWWRRGDSLEYTFLGVVSAFGVPVELAASYSATEPLEDTSGNLEVQERTTEVPIERIADLDADQSNEQIAADNLLLILLDGSGGYEVMTIRSIESPTEGVYPLHVNRARFSTSRLDHAVGAKGYIFERSELPLLTSSAFEGAVQDQKTTYYKAAPINLTETLDLADANKVSIELTEQVGNQVATPVPSLPGGEYPSLPTSMTVTVATSGATIRWSKDETTVPHSATEGNAYPGGIVVDDGDTIYVKAFKAGMLPSDALIATYTEV